MKRILVITVTTKPFKDELAIFPIRYIPGFECLPVGVKTTRAAVNLAKASDGKYDYIMVDAENKLKACQNIHKKILAVCKKSQVVLIKGNDFAADAAFAYHAQLMLIGY